MAESQLAKSRDDLASNLVGDIELDHAHVRRAEGSVLSGSHDAVVGAPRTRLRVVELKLTRERQVAIEVVTSQVGRLRRPLVNPVREFIRQSRGIITSDLLVSQPGRYTKYS